MENILPFVIKSRVQDKVLNKLELGNILLSRLTSFLYPTFYDKKKVNEGVAEASSLINSKFYEIISLFANDESDSSISKTLNNIIKYQLELKKLEQFYKQLFIAMYGYKAKRDSLNVTIKRNYDIIKRVYINEFPETEKREPMGLLKFIALSFILILITFIILMAIFFIINPQYL